MKHLHICKAIENERRNLISYYFKHIELNYFLIRNYKAFVPTN